MALQNSQYDALMRYYQRLQFRNKHEQDARIAEAQARIPRLALIDQEIAAISVKKARILLGDKNATDFDLNEQIQALSRERTDLLKANEIGEYELLEVLDLRQVVKWADKASAKSAAQALGLKTWRYVKI